MSLRLNALLCTSVREIICLSDQEGQPVSWPKKTKNHCWAFETQVWRVLFEGGNPGVWGLVTLVGVFTLLSVWEGLLEKGGLTVSFRYEI